MSIIVKYSTGSTYTVVANKVDIEKVQDLDGQFHVPYTSIVGMMRLGLGVQKITVSGDALDMSACLWHDVVAISFDSGTSYQTVYFSGVPYASDCWSGIYPYILSLLASPLREGAAVRYPTTGYKWGNQSITGISQAGNVNAYPIIHYLAPLFYAPLSNTPIDFAGQAVTFTRSAAKDHAGVTYPANTPIFDSGLYLGSDTAQDVATWTPPASTLRTVAMQIKQTRPITLTNLITNGDFETNTTGWYCPDTTTRTTVSPLAGTASAKSVAAGNAGTMDWAGATLISGHTYYFSGLAKTTAAAGRKMKIYAAVGGAAQNGALVDCSVAAHTVPMTFVAAATSGDLVFQMDSNVAGEYFLLDSVVLYDLTAAFGGNSVYIWSSANNTLRLDFAYNCLTWTDATTNVSVVFPIYVWLLGQVYGQILDVVVIEDTSHAVTIAVHPDGGSWTSATGTLAALTWPQLTLGPLEGSLANLIQYPYVLTSAEYQALVYSSLSLLYNTLYVGNRYAGEIVKGSDKRLVNANGSDISALLGGVDIPIGSSAVTIVQSQGLSARWYVELKRTDV